MRAYILAVFVIVVLPVLIACLMGWLWDGYNMQLPDKGRMGVWLHTFTLPVCALQLLVRVLVYKAFGRRIQIISIPFPYSITPFYRVAPAKGKTTGLLLFCQNSLPLWLLPFMIWVFVLICPSCDVPGLYDGNWPDGCDYSIVTYCVSLVRGAVQLLCQMILDWNSGILKFLGLTYLIVCLSVDFRITKLSLLSLLPGMSILCGLGALVFLMPISSLQMSVLLVKVLPTLFYIQSAIVMIVSVGAVVLWCIICVRKCCSRMLGEK